MRIKNTYLSDFVETQNFICAEANAKVHLIFHRYLLFAMLESTRTAENPVIYGKRLLSAQVD